jgi:hypothetical protein
MMDRKFILVYALLLNSILCPADTISGSGVGKSVAGGTYPNSVLTIKMQSSAVSPQGTFVFDPSSTESYSGFPSVMSVCTNSKGVVTGSGSLQGFHQVGSTKSTLIKGIFTVSVAPGSKGSFNLQFSDYTTGAVIFPMTSYNVMSGGFGMVGESCAL